MSTAYSFVRQFPLLRKPELVPQPAPLRDEVAAFRATLAPAIAARISSASELIRALEREHRSDPLSTSVEEIDRLVGGGLPRGKMTELTGRRSAGRFSLVLATIAAVTSIGEAAALIDVGDHFDPRAAEEMGADLRRLLWVRPRTMKEAVLAAEMLMATGFQLVVLDAGLAPVRGRRAPDTAWVRLTRCAERHGTALLIATPYPMTGGASEGVVAAQRSRPLWHGSGRSPRLLVGITSNLSVEKLRHQRPGQKSGVRFTSPAS
jgi:hypothetical protein